MMQHICPCGSQTSFDLCCEPLLAGKAAATAEALMRSRYTAFTLGRVAYLMKTNSPQASKTFDVKGFDQQLADTQWLGLEIYSSRNGGTEDDSGTVHFVANGLYRGEHFTHEEISRFVRVNKIWLYDSGVVKGEEQPPSRTPKVGRNAPCVCGSGLKFKVCCALKGRA